MDDLVFALVTMTVGHDGRKERLSKGDAWHSGSSLVKARPELFGSRPPKVQGEGPPVEEATAEPGAKRRVRKT